MRSVAAAAYFPLAEAQDPRNPEAPPQTSSLARPAYRSDAHLAWPALPSPHPPPPQVKVTEFSQLRSTLQAAARKQQGSLAVRDLSGLVPPGQLVDTENLTTLLVVVAKSARAEWLAQYEQLSEFVVPRSSEVGLCVRGGRGPLGPRRWGAGLGSAGPRILGALARLPNPWQAHVRWLS